MSKFKVGDLVVHYMGNDPFEVVYITKSQMCIRDERGLYIVNPVNYKLAPKKKKIWINIYPNLNCNNIPNICAHNTREDADRNATGRRLACIEVEYEEGQSLE